MRNYLALTVLLILPAGIFAQEVEKALKFNTKAALMFKKEKNWEPRQGRSGNSLDLPFVDDFSRFSFATEDPDIPFDWQRWEESGAFFNETMPELPPTIGVATLDGLRADGYPYDFNATAYGPADTLTSLPIDISAFDVNSNVYLSFYYQGGGLGNRPESEDSLIVEFYSSDDDAWFNVWSTGGGPDVEDFNRQFIKVESQFFFRTDFRFRFRNYASLSGNLDHWNIDYVVLDENVNPEEFELIDVGFVHPEATLLNQYTSMPWTHFIVNPSAHMAQEISAVQGNLNQDRNIVSGYQVEYEGSEQFDQPALYLNTTGNGFSQFNSSFPVFTDPSNYVYDSSVNDTCAFFDVSLYTNTTPDENRWNDTLRFVQEFTNYYAYDDGSAERAYALENAAGGQVAVRFQTSVADTLLGLFIHFTPFEENVSNETFLLRIWGNNNGIPGDELAENFEFQYPTYYLGEPNIFGYYEYDNPIAIDGVFYAGWVQNTAAEYNVGLDKQGDSNVGNLFYTTGIGSPWFSSTIQGSLMVRPVFKSGKSEVWNNIDESDLVDCLIYPNPTNGHARINCGVDIPGNSIATLHDISGRAVEEFIINRNNPEIDLSNRHPGLYIVLIKDEKGKLIHRSKVVKK